MVSQWFILSILRSLDSEKSSKNKTHRLKKNQPQGHEVTIYTSHYDQSHCFQETRNLNIVVRGDFLPRTILGRGHIVFASLRSIYLSFFAAWSSRADVFHTDQISLYNLCLAVLRPRTPIVFYCHFPDKLLASRSSWIRTLYRMPFDAIEELATACADTILCNSEFTRGVFRSNFRRLQSVLKDDLGVLHPATKFEIGKSPPDLTQPGTFLSINRYERKKNIGLAIRALASLRDDIMGEKQFRAHKVHLIIAGGYDERVAENVEHYKELVSLAKSKGLHDCVTFVRSFTDEEKSSLLRDCVAVLYTPNNEHFGIVPLECMSAGRPVIAVNSGGPTETVMNDQTGYLCDAENPKQWAERMESLLGHDGSKRSIRMGLKGMKHVSDNFSFAAFQRKLDTHITSANRTKRVTNLMRWILFITVTLMYVFFSWYVL